MHADGKFAELYFVMEACHSGSMFDALPKDINSTLPGEQGL